MSLSTNSNTKVCAPEHAMTEGMPHPNGHKMMGSICTGQARRCITMKAKLIAVHRRSTEPHAAVACTDRTCTPSRLLRRASLETVARRPRHHRSRRPLVDHCRQAIRGGVCRHHAHRPAHSQLQLGQGTGNTRPFCTSHLKLTIAWPHAAAAAR